MLAAFIHELEPNKMAILTELADELEHRQSQELGEETVKNPSSLDWRAANNLLTNAEK
jgi:hypothetical protein